MFVDATLPSSSIEVGIVYFTQGQCTLRAVADHSQGAWSRACADFRAVLHTAKFWSCEVIALAVAGVLGGYLAWGQERNATAAIGLGTSLAVAGLLAGMVFAVLWVTAPVRQRDEARAFLRETASSNVRLTMGGQGVTTHAEGRVISLLNITVYNGEDYPISLTFDMQERFRLQDEHGPLAIALTPTDPPDGLSDLIKRSPVQTPKFQPLSRPLNVPPRQAISGDYHFLRPQHYDNWGEHEGFDIRVLDHHSGRRTDVQSMGSFTLGRSLETP